MKRILTGIGLLVVLLGLLSVTLLNKQFPLMRMSSLMRTGRLAMEQRDYGAAIDAYRLAITVGERDTQAYLKLAEACVFNGQPKDALYYLELGMKKTNKQELRDAYNNLLGTLPSPSPLPEEPSPDPEETAQPDGEEPSSGIVISFPDPYFEAEVREIISKPSGEITRDDVAEVTSVLILNKNITDLSGIEYFTALRELDCNDSGLTALDVSGLTELIWIGCSGNKLTELNVSGCVSLLELDCSANQLTELDVSDCAALTFLNCCDNQLTVLDVSNNSALTQLFCNYNNFPELSAISGLDESRTTFTFDPQNSG